MTQRNMISAGLFLSAIVALFVAAPLSATAADLPAKLVYQDTIDQIIFDGVNFVPTPFDLYYVQVENNSGQDLFTLEGVSFNGPWKQESAVPIFSQVGTALPADPFDGVVPPTGDNFTPDSFFSYTSGGSTPFADSPVDTTSSLGATTVAALGDAWIPTGATDTIAVLTVAAGTDIDPTSPSFYDMTGGFIVSGEIFNLNFVPEPGTMALASLGLIGVFARRRRS